MPIKKSDFRRGVEAAAHYIDDFNSLTTHPYRLGDSVLCKLNATSRKEPRRNQKRLLDPRNEFIKGMALVLAEVGIAIRLGRASDAVLEVARAAGLTLSELESAGADPSQVREMKRAGLK